jgi:hypothetical protein
MRHGEVVAWVLSVCAGLRLSQAKTLADLTAAALRLGRASLAALGRRLLGPRDAKHRIKRAWRFCANEGVVVSEAMRGVIGRLLKRRKKPLVVALDWTDIRSFHTLVAAAVMKGRAVPLLWASFPKWKLFKSQNAFEEGFLHLLRTLIPESVPVVLLADRGFGRVDMATACRNFTFHYLIRIKPDAWVEHPSFRGRLKDYPVARGMRRVLRGARHRKTKPVTHNLVIRWKPGLPAGRDEPWYLMTDLERPAAALTDLYAKRTTIEELFRDGKSRRNGFALRATRLTKAERVDRLLLVLALAYILLVGLGLRARQSHRPGFWGSSNDPGECSAFTIGRAVLDRIRRSPDSAFAAVREATAQAAEKWG